MEICESGSFGDGGLTPLWSQGDMSPCAKKKRGHVRALQNMYLTVLFLRNAKATKLRRENKVKEASDDAETDKQHQQHPPSPALQVPTMTFC